MPSKSYKGQDGRRDVLLFDPQSLVLVDDEKHPLYDPRIHLPLDEALVENIKAHGVLEPVIVVPDGDRMLVVAGRQRVRAARAAKVTVPCVMRKGDAVDLAGVMISENEIRRNDPPSLRARRMQHLENHGYSIERIALQFGISATAVRNTLRLLDCDKAVQGAVDAGSVSVANAARIAEKPRAEQKELLAEMQAKGATKGKAASKAIDGAGVSKPQRMRSRAMLEKLVPLVAANEAAVLRFVLGGEPKGELALAVARSGVRHDQAIRGRREPEGSRARSTSRASGLS